MLEQRQNMTSLGQSLSVRASDTVLYVLQGEFAVVRVPSSAVRYLGSAEATTCLVVAVKILDNAVIAHVDCKEACESLVQQCDSLVESKNVCVADVWMIGAFKDNQCIGETLVQSCFDAMRDSLNIQFRINVAKVLESNTSSLGGPACTGMLFDIVCSTAHPAVFDDFLNCGGIAYRTRRCARRWLLSVIGPDSFIPILENVWDTASDTYVFESFSCHLTIELTWILQRWLKLADDALLSIISTSPMFESSTFCEEQRTVFRWMLENNGRQIPRQRLPWNSPVMVMAST